MRHKNILLKFQLIFTKFKPWCVFVHVAIGQVMLFMRCNVTIAIHAQEALKQAKFKFPSRHKMIINKKW